MPFRVKCPDGHVLIVPDSKAGRDIRCPRCGAVVSLGGSVPKTPITPSVPTKAANPPSEKPALAPPPPAGPKKPNAVLESAEKPRLNAAPSGGTQEKKLSKKESGDVLEQVIEGLARAKSDLTPAEIPIATNKPIAPLAESPSNHSTNERSSISRMSSTQNSQPEANRDSKKRSNSSKFEESNAKETRVIGPKELDSPARALNDGPDPRAADTTSQPEPSAVRNPTHPVSLSSQSARSAAKHNTPNLSDIKPQTKLSNETPSKALAPSESSRSIPSESPRPPSHSAKPAPANGAERPIYQPTPPVTQNHLEGTQRLETETTGKIDSAGGLAETGSVGGILIGLAIFGAIPAITAFCLRYPLFVHPMPIWSLLLFAASATQIGLALLVIQSRDRSGFAVGTLVALGIAAFYAMVSGLGLMGGATSPFLSLVEIPNADGRMRCTAWSTAMMCVSIILAYLCGIAKPKTMASSP